MAKYTDINLNFTPHPITGDVTLVSDEKSINQAIRNIVLRNTYETPYMKDLAGNITGLLFELATPFITEDVKARIKYVLENYEPRMEIQEITSTWIEEENKLYVNLVYRARTSTQDISLDFYLDRIV